MTAKTISILLVIVLTSLTSAICTGSGQPSARQEILQAAKNQAETLNLSNRGLTELPAEIGQLSHLKVLKLDDNALTRLPPEIGQLTTLTKLHLTYNQLSTLPPEIGRLSNLIELDVGNNRLESLPGQIGQLSSLEWLLLNKNQLTHLPPEVGRLANLRQLVLGGQSTGVAAAGNRAIVESDPLGYRAKPVCGCAASGLRPAQPERTVSGGQSSDGFATADWQFVSTRSAVAQKQPAEPSAARNRRIKAPKETGPE